VALLLLAAPGCEDLPVVPNVPPVASFIYSPVSPINAGQSPVVFNGTASRDSDGTVATYIWNFGDGSAEERGSAATVSHVFPVVGQCIDVTYTALLTVVDDDGGQGSASQTVKVTNLCR